MAETRDAALDPTSGDLSVQGGDLALLEDHDQLAQEVRLTLRTIVGEWFLDTSHGIDYFGKILRKNAQQPAVEAELRDKITAVERVRSLRRFEGDYDTVRRRFSLDFTVDTDFGLVDVEATVPPIA